MAAPPARDAGQAPSFLRRRAPPGIRPTHPGFRGREALHASPGGVPRRPRRRTELEAPLRRPAGGALDLAAGPGETRALSSKAPPATQAESRMRCECPRIRAFFVLATSTAQTGVGSCSPAGTSQPQGPPGVRVEASAWKGGPGRSSSRRSPRRGTKPQYTAEASPTKLQRYLLDILTMREGLHTYIGAGIFACVQGCNCSRRRRTSRRCDDRPLQFRSCW